MKILTTEDEAASLKARFEGVNRAEFARTHDLKGGQSMIYQNITGRRPISMEAAMAYARGFGCSLEDISPRLAKEAAAAARHLESPQALTEILPGAMRVVIAEPGDPDFYEIPKVQLVLSAGMTGFQTVPEIYDGSKLSISKNWVDRHGYVPGRLIAIRVKGDSMEPNLYDGDQVIINTADTRMEDGAVFAVNFEGQAVVKRLARDRGEWWLTSDNPDQVRHRRKSCREGECIIIGRIVKRETDRI